MPCTLDRCSEWCRQVYGRSIGSVGFGCQNVGGFETLGLCECSEGGYSDVDLPRAVLCHELLACSSCAHGYCSTSPEKNRLFNNSCVACEPGFVLLPTGSCVTASAESIYTCPMNNPCIHGVCLDGNTDMEIPYSCKCRQGFEGPLCNAGAIQFLHVPTKSMGCNIFLLFSHLALGNQLQALVLW